MRNEEGGGDPGDRGGAAVLEQDVRRDDEMSGGQEKRNEEQGGSQCEVHGFCSVLVLLVVLLLRGCVTGGVQEKTGERDCVQVERDRERARD